MAKYTFTQYEFDEIRLLLRRRRLENSDEQKKTRAKIRKSGFMISDYYKGFSNFDFKNLNADGEIEITKKSIQGRYGQTKRRRLRLQYQFQNLINQKKPYHHLLIRILST